MPPQPLDGFLLTAGPSPGGYPQEQPQSARSSHLIDSSHLHEPKNSAKMNSSALQAQQMLPVQDPTSVAVAADEQPRPGYISLTMMIEFIIQRTYHDLSVLAELLPRKTDMERKIEVYNFSARTKQLFIRLLALVRWASSAKTVEKACDIMMFLDRQSMMFIETADALSCISRDMLASSRMPNLQIPEAIEVLTTGTYSRLPKCISESILPIEPLVGPERRQTLSRLNRIIQHRLVTGATLPEQMRNFKIEHGRVQFRVDQEFEVGLTLMGDSTTIPWRLLEIDILVEDTESASAGTALVHIMQLSFIHQLVQARLENSANPVQEVYDCLHYFCQSLQLEVLFGQTMHLKQHRLNDSIQVEDYVRGQRLTVSYWRDLSQQRSGVGHGTDLGYRLTVQSDPNDSARPLAVFHLPSIGNRNAAEMADRAVRSDRLSMERLLVHTVYIRSLARLSDLRAEFQSFLKDVEYDLRGTPAVLTVPILLPCHSAEHMHISVDTHSGQLRAQVPKHPHCPLMADIQTSMNGDQTRLPNLIIQLRFWLARRRCEFTLQRHQVCVYEHLPLQLNDVTPDTLPEHAPFVESAHNRVFVRYNQQPDAIIAVEMHDDPNQPAHLLYSFSLLCVSNVPVSTAVRSAKVPSASSTTIASGASAKTPSTASSPVRNQRPTTSSTDPASVVNDMLCFNPASFGQTPATVKLPQHFVHVRSVSEFDSFALSHGPGTQLFEASLPKRARLAFDHIDDYDATIDYHQSVAYVVPELAHTVALFFDRLPFVALANELDARGIAHSGVQSECDASAVCMRILTMPRPFGVSVAPTATTSACFAPAPWDSLQRRLLSVTIRQRLHKNLHSRSWSLEMVFAGSPLYRWQAGKLRSKRYSVQRQYDLLATDQISVTADAILNDWSRVAHLYGLVYALAERIADTEDSSLVGQDRLRTRFTVRSYTFVELLLGYGPHHECLCTVRWCVDRHAFRLHFSRLNANRSNPHAIVCGVLEEQLNRDFSLAHLVDVMHDTWRPLSCLAELTIVPHYGIPRPTVPVLSFCLLPQTPRIVRLVYQAMYCLEVRIHGSGLLSIRDGAYSHFAKAPGPDDYPVSQGLLTFLRQYAVDPVSSTTSLCMRRIEGEEDNPATIGSTGDECSLAPASTSTSVPAPFAITLTFANGGKSQPHSPIMATAPGASGLRFTASVTPPPTPASPIAAASQNSPANGVRCSSPLQQRSGNVALHSPQSFDGHSQQPQEHSPFGVPSPAAAHASPRPPATRAMMATAPAGRSRIGGFATTLTDDSFEVLLRPCAHPEPGVQGPMLSPLERFLGCVNLRRNLQRYIQTEDFLTPIDCPSIGVVMFRVDTLQFQVKLNATHQQSLHLKVRQVPPTATTATTGNLASTSAAIIKPATGYAKSGPLHQWSALDLQTLERYFEQRVVAPPYRPNTLFGFCRMLNVPSLVLRDLLQIVRIEMHPETAAEVMPGLRWHVQLLMRVPPSAPVIVPTGNAAVHMIRQKILFFLQITRIPKEYNTSAANSPPATPHENGADVVAGSTATDSPADSGLVDAELSRHSELPTIVIPMVYDVNANITQLAERRDASGTIASSATNSASQLLRRFAELHKANAAATGECTIFPAIRELLINYVMPEPHAMAAAAASTMPNVTSSPPIEAVPVATVDKTAANQTLKPLVTIVAAAKASVISEVKKPQAQHTVPSPTIAVIGGGSNTHNNNGPTMKANIVSPAAPPTSATSTGGGQKQSNIAYN